MRPRTLYRSVLFSAVVALGLPYAPCLAWGAAGHAVVADIAEQYLSPDAADMVKGLLSTEGYVRLQDVASWADEARTPATAHWHFVDIPRGAQTYDQARDCAGRGSCVVDALGREMAILSDGSRSATQRVVALKWVIHLAGDLHQPLHAIDDHDRGGNEIGVVWMEHRENLHAVWDSGVIAAETGVKGAGNSAYVLSSAIARQYAGDAPSFLDGEGRGIERRGVTGQAALWVTESHIAGQRAYDLFEQMRGLPAWDRGYSEKSWVIVRGQLERGGVRLAALLDIAAAAAKAARR